MGWGLIGGQQAYTDTGLVGLEKYFSNGDPLMIGARPTRILKKQEWGEGMEEEGAR